jgi:hypothetical protein
MAAPAESAMTRFVKLLPAILALPLCAQAAAPQMFKCKDADGNCRRPVDLSQLFEAAWDMI